LVAVALRQGGLHLQHVFQQRGILLVTIGLHPQILGRRLLRQLRHGEHLPGFHQFSESIADVDQDLVLGFLDGQRSLAHDPGLFGQLVALSMPVERFPLDGYAYHGEVAGDQTSEVERREVVESQADVRDLFGLLDAAVVVGLLDLELSLLKLRPVVERDGARGFQVARLPRGVRNRADAKCSADVAAQQAVQQLLLRGQRIAQRQRIVLGLGQPRLHFEALALEGHLFGNVLPGQPVQLAIQTDALLHGFERALRLEDLVERPLHLFDDGLFLLPVQLHGDLAPEFQLLDPQAEFVLLGKRLSDPAHQQTRGLERSLNGSCLRRHRPDAGKCSEGSAVEYKIEPGESLTSQCGEAEGRQPAGAEGSQPVLGALDIKRRRL
jgi:hypothetical protein